MYRDDGPFDDDVEIGDEFENFFSYFLFVLKRKRIPSVSIVFFSSLFSFL